MEKDYPDCFECLNLMDEDYPKRMECFECKEKRKKERLMREKALKRPFLQQDQEEQEDPTNLNTRNGPLVIQERDEEDKVEEEERPVEEESEKLNVEEEEPQDEYEEDRVPETYKEEERQPEKLTIEEEEEWPMENFIDMLCVAARPDMEIQWKETHGVAGEEKPQKEAKLAGENKDEDSQQEMPEELKNHVQEMGGRDVKFLLQRKMRRSHGLKHLPIDPIQKILTKEEKKMFSEEGKGMEVEVVEPSLQHAHIGIRRWQNKEGHFYALTNKNWIDLVRRNALRAVGTLIQLWSFRNEDSKLFLAVVRVKEEQKKKTVALQIPAK